MHNSKAYPSLQQSYMIGEILFSLGEGGEGRGEVIEEFMVHKMDLNIFHVLHCRDLGQYNNFSY